MFGWLRYQISPGTVGIVISVVALALAYFAYTHETSLEKRMDGLQGQVVALTEEVQKLAPGSILLRSQGDKTSPHDRINGLESSVRALTHEVQQLRASDERIWKELTPRVKLLRDHE